MTKSVSSGKQSVFRRNAPPMPTSVAGVLSCCDSDTEKREKISKAGKPACVERSKNQKLPSSVPVTPCWKEKKE
jgi:hypothetical protein